MATYNWGVDKTFIALDDLSDKQYRFVHASGAGYVSLAVTTAGSVLGVLQNDPVAGEEAQVRMIGFTKVMSNTEAAASLIYFGSPITTASDGMARGLNSITASFFSAGLSMETVATGSGQYIEALIMPQIVRG
jgi:hypothetical protein